jgi:NADH:ubiquinone oxidoreductase subunit 2 (subunit N)
MSKWQIFVAGFEGSNPWLMGLVVFAAMNSVLSLAYYAPIVNMLYHRNMGEVVQRGAAIPVAMSIPLVIFTLAIVLIGFMPSLMNWLTEPAAQALLVMFGK